MVTLWEVKGNNYSEEINEEMELIYRELAKRYCSCNHKKEYHVNGEYECKWQGYTLNDGKMEIFQCHCRLYTSIESSATLEKM